MLFLYFLRSAYYIRLHAIEEYGLVIHEFDPWFNYRATEYLAQHGTEKFFKWYDYMAWYPLGRPVGTTIYPGMQISAVAIWKALGALGAVNEDWHTVMFRHAVVSVPPFPDEGSGKGGGKWDVRSGVGSDKSASWEAWACAWTSEEREVRLATREVRKS